MKNFILITALLFVIVSCKEKQENKFVIGIVIDQMKQEYFEKYRHRFSDDGLLRIYDNGTAYTNTHLNYTPTYTAVGHASIHTGKLPSQHGVVGNNWYDKASKNVIYCVDDNNYHTIGSNNNGKKSPKNLKVETLGDSLSKYHNFKTTSLSLKDRSAILSAGIEKHETLWFDPLSGNFISSSYYINELPLWVQAFNSDHIVDALINTTWTTSHEIKSYLNEDSKPSEIGFQEKNTFPYHLGQLKDSLKPYALIFDTPQGNTLLTYLAIKKLENTSLDNKNQMLLISYSATDGMGHKFGPHSVEIEDCYIKLDKEIEGLLTTLDEKFGKENYTLFITSDHGVADSPMDHNKDWFYNSELLFNELKKSCYESFKDSLLIEKLIFNNIYLNDKRIDTLKLTNKEVAKSIEEYLINKELISSVYNSFDQPIDSMTHIIKNGHCTDRSGTISFQYKSGYLSDHFSHGGTTHGSYYPYDTNIPFVLYGNNIPKKKDNTYKPVSFIRKQIEKLIF